MLQRILNGRSAAPSLFLKDKKKKTSQMKKKKREHLFGESVFVGMKFLNYQELNWKKKNIAIVLFLFGLFVAEYCPSARSTE